MYPCWLGAGDSAAGSAHLHPLRCGGPNFNVERLAEQLLRSRHPRQQIQRRQHGGVRAMAVGIKHHVVASVDVHVAARRHGAPRAANLWPPGSNAQPQSARVVVHVYGCWMRKYDHSTDRKGTPEACPRQNNARHIGSTREFGTEAAGIGGNAGGRPRSG